jgi:uncharacterized protein (DUF2252 family)
MCAAVATDPVARRPSPAAVAPPDAEERAARGRAARSLAPRSSHGRWEPRDDRRPVVDVLLGEAADRVPELVPIRHGRMLVSPFTFYRGAAGIMAADLHGTPDSGIQVQLCGDAHLSNFGGFASPERRLVFDINDFDETTRGPWEWDVKRLGASIAIAGRDVGLEAPARRAAVEATVGAYREAMRTFATMRNLDVWYARLDVERVFADHGERLTRQERRNFKQRVANARAKDHLRTLKKLTRQDDGEMRIVSRPPLIVPIEELVPGEDGEALEAGMRRLLAEYRRTLPRELQHLFDTYEYRHMARKVVGVGSVGTRAWIVLLTGRDDTDPLFLQVKEAGPSALAPFVGRGAVRHGGRRVVEGQRLMQAAGDIFLGWLRSDYEGIPRDYYVRQLWDWKTSAEVEGISKERLTVYGQVCGWTLARAHARSGDRIAIAAYLGAGATFDRAIAGFAEAYADQTERDFETLIAAVSAGLIPVERDV